MKKYYIHIGTEQQGPFDLNELKEKNIHKETYIWYEGLKDWTTADKVDELSDFLRTASPPPFGSNKNTPPPINLTQNSPIDLNDLNNYWYNEFKRIIDSNESYKGEWNWFAFLFSTIWFFVKGAWFWGVAYLSLGITLGKLSDSFSESLPAQIGIVIVYLILGVVAGAKGNWIYYNVKIKNLQNPKDF
ncbi:MAG: GYF domain-containing protein [Bacteroidota bacterium]